MPEKFVLAQGSPWKPTGTPGSSSNFASVQKACRRLGECHDLPHQEYVKIVCIPVTWTVNRHSIAHFLSMRMP